MNKSKFSIVIFTITILIFSGLQNKLFAQNGFLQSAVRTFESALSAITVDEGVTPGSGIYIGKGAAALSTGESTAIGVNALSSATNGARNTAVGYFTLRSIAVVNPAYDGANNTAVGWRSMEATTTGSNNAAFGSSSLIKNNYGSSNTAVGHEALSLSDSGSNNVAVGAGALGQAKPTNNNVAVGVGSLKYAKSTGNTSSGHSSLAQLEFGLTSGTGGSNSAYGSNSLSSLVSGNGNSALGTASMRNRTSGSNNVAIGLSSLSGTTGATGNNNTAIGNSALSNLNVGDNNVGIGNNAQVTSGLNNQLSIQNVIYGVNMSSAANGRVGIGTVPNATSTAKLEVDGTLRLNVVNTAVNNLRRFLFVDPADRIVKEQVVATGSTNNCNTPNLIPVSTATGDMNCSQIFDDGTSVGIGAAYNTGTFNFAYIFPLGLGTYITGPVTPPSSGTLKLAADGIVQAVAFYANSDGRLKTNVKEVNNATKLIRDLRPVTYEWSESARKIKNLGNIPQVGFIAQEVGKVVPEAVIKNSDGYYSMNYTTIIPILTQGIKEQQVQIEKQEKEIAALKASLDEIKNMLNNQPVNASKTKSGSSIKVNPNPVTGVSRINYTVEEEFSKGMIVVYNLEGKIVKQYNLPAQSKNGQIQINKNEFVSGMYIIALISGNKEITTEKCLIMN